MLIVTVSYLYVSILLIEHENAVLKFLRINIFKLIKRLFDINMGWNTIWCKRNMGGLVTPFMKNKQ